VGCTREKKILARLHICNVTHFIFTTWLMYMCNMIHFTCATWLVQVSFICETWFIGASCEERENYIWITHLWVTHKQHINESCRAYEWFHKCVMQEKPKKKNYTWMTHLWATHTNMGWLRVAGSLKFRSLLQKSPIQKTIFCKRDL